MSKIFRFLEKSCIPYAVIRAEGELYRINEIKDCKLDLDIVLNCTAQQILPQLVKSTDFKQIDQHSFLDIKKNLRIDLYFKTINVGYYHFLKIQESSFKRKIVSHSEYVIYQLLDPLLKFSYYHPRHKLRLEKYISDGIDQKIIQTLEKIIGYRLSCILLKKISNKEFVFSVSFIQRCKFRMLFINGNFVKMIKSRVF